MTPEQRKIAEALGRCRFLVGSPDKRFAQNMSDAARDNSDHPYASAKLPLTERQAANLTRLAWKYRRQMPADCVPKEKPE